MSALTIHLQTAALEELQAKAAQIGREPEAALVGARGAANLTRQHLFALDERSPRSHFYSAAAKSVEEPVVESGGASFTINKVGLAQRWLGGTITAGKGTSSVTGGPTHYLAIGTPEVEDKTPWEVSTEQDVAFVPRRGDKAMLVTGMQTTVTRGPNKGKTVIRAVPGGLVLFWLVPEVTQDADPMVLPAEEDLGEAARYHMDNYLTQLLGTGPAGGGAGGAN
jgi:hypothetical protein